MTTENYWLVKSEPSAYSWQQLVKDKRTSWGGVRNFAARNNLRAMKVGDRVLFYHSNEGKDIVGIAKVVKAAYPDPSAKDGDWTAVDLAPLAPLHRPVSLAQLKADKRFVGMALLARPRLSVSPVSLAEFSAILKIAETKP
jgi:predicted RNA-binding protein with PUA-like domain